jgi:hypothetical protein
MTAAVWVLLFVILDTTLGTAFIAAGSVSAASALAAVAASAASTRRPPRAALDAPLTSAGMLLGIATFAILEVVLSVPMWIGVISGLGVVGLYGLANAASCPWVKMAGEPRGEQRDSSQRLFPSVHNGHDHATREPVGAR